MRSLWRRHCMLFCTRRRRTGYPPALASFLLENRQPARVAALEADRRLAERSEHCRHRSTILGRATVSCRLPQRTRRSITRSFRLMRSIFASFVPAKAGTHNTAFRCGKMQPSALSIDNAMGPAFAGTTITEGISDMSSLTGRFGSASGVPWDRERTHGTCLSNRCGGYGHRCDHQRHSPSGMRSSGALGVADTKKKPGSASPASRPAVARISDTRGRFDESSPRSGTCARNP